MPITLSGDGAISGLTSTGISAVQKLPAGTVLQVLSTTKVDAFTTTSGSSVDVTGLTVNITPTSASNKVLIFAQIYGGSDASTALYVNLVRNSTALGVGTSGTGFNSTMGSFFGAGTLYSTYPIVFLDSPATTAATTYKIQVFSGGGTVAVNRRASDAIVGGSSTITVMEISG